MADGLLSGGLRASVVILICDRDECGRGKEMTVVNAGSALCRSLGLSFNVHENAACLAGQVFLSQQKCVSGSTSACLRKGDCAKYW